MCGRFLTATIRRLPFPGPSPRFQHSSIPLDSVRSRSASRSRLCSLSMVRRSSLCASRKRRSSSSWGLRGGFPVARAFKALAVRGSDCQGPAASRDALRSRIRGDAGRGEQYPSLSVIADVVVDPSRLGYANRRWCSCLRPDARTRRCRPSPASRGKWSSITRGR